MKFTHFLVFLPSILSSFFARENQVKVKIDILKVDKVAGFRDGKIGKLEGMCTLSEHATRRRFFRRRNSNPDPDPYLTF